MSSPLLIKHFKKNISIFAGLFYLLFLCSCAKEELITKDNSVRQSNNFSLCDQSEEVKNKYEQDAYRLALQMAEEQGKTNIKIDKADYQQALDALIAVYNAKQFPACDSVIHLYDVHTLPGASMQRIIIGVNPAQAWTRSWLAGSTITDNASVNNLMNTYELTVSEYYKENNFVVLTSTQPLNINLLARIFSGINGVNYAEEDRAGGDGNHIWIRTLSTEVLQLTYSVGYNDCFAGCMNRRAWYFNVHPDCTVTYEGSEGDSAP